MRGCARKERQHLIPSQLLPENDSAGRIRSVRLKNVLRKIQPDGANFRPRTPPSRWLLNTPIWHIDAVGGRPPHHWKTTTFTAGLRLDGLTAPMLLDGAMNGPAFFAYVEQVLAPELAPGDIVVMDNLPAHKVSGVRKAIEKAGARLLLLPPYSPDFNPIEMAFAKLKALCAKPPREPSTSCGPSSGGLLGPVHTRPSAPTISPTQAIHGQRECALVSCV